MKFYPEYVLHSYVIVEYLFQVCRPVWFFFLQFGLIGATVATIALSVAGWGLHKWRLPPVWLKDIVLSLMGGIVGLVGLSLLRYAFDWLFFRASLSDGQYAFVWLITIPFGAVFGVLAGATLGLSSKPKVAGWLSVIGNTVAVAPLMVETLKEAGEGESIGEISFTLFPMPIAISLIVWGVWLLRK